MGKTTIQDWMKEGYKPKVSKDIDKEIYNHNLDDMVQAYEDLLEASYSPSEQLELDFGTATLDQEPDAATPPFCSPKEGIRDCEWKNVQLVYSVAVICKNCGRKKPKENHHD